MADKKISELAVADTLTGSELAEVVQGGVNKRAPTSQFGAPVIDEDNFATDSATRPPSQQSVRVYADAVVGVGTTSGTNSYTVNVGSPKTILTSGNLYAIRFAAASTGASTLDVQSSGAKKIFKDASTQVGNGDIPAGAILNLMYHESLDGGSGGYMIIGLPALAAAVWGSITGTITDQSDLVSYVSAQILAAVQGLKWKDSVKVATTANGTLATAYENGDTVDGVTLVTGDRILIKNQSTQSENGIYIVNASGAPTRAGDANVAAELEGATVTVQQGTSNANTTWTQTTDGITLGSSNIVWAQFGSSVPNADASTAGIAKLYTSTGSNTDGSMTQNAITTAIAAVRDPIQFAVSDESTPITAGTTKFTFRMPRAMTLGGIRASLTTAQTSGSIFTVDVNMNGTSILSTKLTIDNTEKTSTTAATPAVISTSSLTDDAEITVDVDQVGSGDATGLKISLLP